MKALHESKMHFILKLFSFSHLDCLKSDQHLALQSLKGGVQSCGAELVESAGDAAHGGDLLVAHVLEDLHDDLRRQLHQRDLPPANRAATHHIA